MQELLLYDISITSYSLLNIGTYGSTEIHFAEIGLSKIVICVQTYGSIKEEMLHNNTHFLPYIH